MSFLPALISLHLSCSTVCVRLLLSIYIHNAVYVLLPIMLSISVFLLLLAGWKGVRGGLSQLIYHIKYQPSSIFSLTLSHPLVHPSLFSHFFSLTLFFFTSHHLHLSFSHLSSVLFYHFSLLHSLWFAHTSPPEPDSAHPRLQSLFLSLF